MKKIFTFILFIALFQNLISQELKEAPLNKEFKKFIESKKQAKGEMPAPTTYVFTNDIKIDFSKSDFPASYDLRDYSLISSVKNQGSVGHCWSFAAIGSIEARELKLGFQEYNLSEHNMATCHGFEWEQGGNQSIATAYLSRLSGPLLESDDPYIADTICSGTNAVPKFYVPESRFLPRNPDVIKYILMNYGAIAVSYHHDDDYFNDINNTYYYSGTDGSNHGVLLVGWDDDKTTAGGTGAWIIKNSWGAFWGDNGYFYMSYDDYHAINKGTIYPIRLETNNIDTILMYDQFGEITSYGYSDYEDYALIKHSVSEEYNFTKVGTYIGAMNSVIDIEVFSTKTENILTDTLAKKYDIYCEFPGYYTFDIPFTTNSDFYIKVRYKTPEDKYPIPVETEVADYAYPQIESNVGWISNNGEIWTAIGNGTNTKIDLCIRAYGTKKDIQASLNADFQSICPGSNVTFYNTSIGDIISYNWDFGQNATPATASTEGPHSVSYSTEGFKTIKLVIENSTGSKDSITLYNYIEVTSDFNLGISPADSTYLNLGDNLELTAFGADSYYWYPSSLITGDNTSNKVVVSPTADAYIYVDGTMNSCTVTDSVKIIITERPENDDVCNAIELALNTELGPFTNANASVQNNEPFPDTTGSQCNTPGYWCSEGGLQNSIWFKFTAPKSGVVSIETDGFDNQIAVYEAENCADIVSGDESLYTIVAANDDWQDADYSATISELSGLKSGKVYWLQMDGSAGGDEGECMITITGYSADNDSPCDAKQLSFFTSYSENNEYASVDVNEPYPGDSDCSAQDSWCPGDTLNATVWYKFNGPATGKMSLESTGFDNQIAIYSTSDCNNLLTGNSSDYSILAANDTYDGNDAASIHSVSGLTENETYYIQVDGKNDAFYGNFTLYLKEWPLSNGKNLSETPISVYPNPSNGEFKIDLSQIKEIENNSTIEIISVDGSHISTIKCEQGKFEYDITIDRSGMYIINVNTLKTNHTIPIVIK